MARGRKLRRLGLVTVVAAIVAVGAVVVLRQPMQRATGVNADVRPGGRAELDVPDGYMSAVFAEGLATPRSRGRPVGGQGGTVGTSDGSIPLRFVRH